MAALEATRNRKAKGTELVSLSDLSPLLDKTAASWPREIPCGQRLVVDMPTADAQTIHNVFARTARRWQLKVTVRNIGNGVMFKFVGKPTKRMA